MGSVIAFLRSMSRSVIYVSRCVFPRPSICCILLVTSLSATTLISNTIRSLLSSSSGFPKSLITRTSDLTSGRKLIESLSGIRSDRLILYPLKEPWFNQIRLPGEPFQDPIAFITEVYCHSPSGILPRRHP